MSIFTFTLSGNILVSFLITFYKYKCISNAYYCSLIYLNSVVKVITVVNIWFYTNIVVYVVYCITYLAYVSLNNYLCKLTFF